MQELSQLLEVSTTVSFCTTKCDPLCKVLCCVDAAPSIQLSTCQRTSLLQNCIMGISDEVKNALRKFPYISSVGRPEIIMPQTFAVILFLNSLKNLAIIPQPIATILTLRLGECGWYHCAR